MKTKILFLLSLFVLQTYGVEFQSRLINGKPVPSGAYREVIKIKSQGSMCTATIVGPRTLVTAAHCAPNGATVSFTANGQDHRAKITRSSLYPAKDHDIAIGIIENEVTGIEPASIGGTALKGLGVTLLGYGCTQIGGGTSDGVLRYGETVIVEFNNFDFVSRKPDGAALCFGDSGGPAFVIENGRHILLGINSKGDIQETNYNTRTDISESQTFLKTFAQNNQLEICGINKNCGGVVPPAPTCNLSAAPSPITLGQSLTLALSAQGQVASAAIENVSVTLVGGKAERKITPSSVGNFTATATVSGPGGSASCTAGYSVKEKPPIDPPSCNLAVSPSQIKLGESVTASLTTFGQVNSANIDGQSVGNSGGSIKITPQFSGNLTSTGTVSGPGGSSQCTASYFVEGPTPNVPNFTAVPTYCGPNTINETQVKEVCTAYVKFSQRIRDLTLKELLIVNFRDGSQEIMPVLNKKEIRADASGRATQELTLYANNLKLKDNNLMLDTRVANMVLGSSGSQAGVPVSLTGRSIKNGQAFYVEKFKKLGE